jgi:hypothetical protein
LLAKAIFTLHYRKNDRSHSKTGNGNDNLHACHERCIRLGNSETTNCRLGTRKRTSDLRQGRIFENNFFSHIVETGDISTKKM